MEESDENLNMTFLYTNKRGGEEEKVETGRFFLALFQKKHKQPKKKKKKIIQHFDRRERGVFLLIGRYYGKPWET